MMIALWIEELLYQNSQEADIKDRLIVFDIKNNSIKNTTINFNYSIVPNLISYSILELSHRIHLKDLTLYPII